MNTRPQSRISAREMNVIIDLLLEDAATAKKMIKSDAKAGDKKGKKSKYAEMNPAEISQFAIRLKKGNEKEALAYVQERLDNLKDKEGDEVEKAKSNLAKSISGLTAAVKKGSDKDGNYTGTGSQYAYRMKVAAGTNTKEDDAAFSDKESAELQRRSDYKKVKDKLSQAEKSLAKAEKKKDKKEIEKQQALVKSLTDRFDKLKNKADKDKAKDKKSKDGKQSEPEETTTEKKNKKVEKEKADEKKHEEVVSALERKYNIKLDREEAKKLKGKDELEIAMWANSKKIEDTKEKTDKIMNTLNSLTDELPDDPATKEIYLKKQKEDLAKMQKMAKEIGIEKEVKELYTLQMQKIKEVEKSDKDKGKSEKEYQKELEQKEADYQIYKSFKSMSSEDLEKLVSNKQKKLAMGDLDSKEKEEIFKAYSIATEILIQRSEKEREKDYEIKLKSDPSFKAKWDDLESEYPDLGKDKLIKRISKEEQKENEELYDFSDNFWS